LVKPELSFKLREPKESTQNFEREVKRFNDKVLKKFKLLKEKLAVQDSQ